MGLLLYCVAEKAGLPELGTGVAGLPVLACEDGGLRRDLGSGAAEVARIVSEVRDRVHVEPAAPSADPGEDRYRLHRLPPLKRHTMWPRLTVRSWSGRTSA